jgi:uncharacterized protein YidB (DUF937 family)
MGMFDILGGGNRRGGMSPIALAVIGALAYRTLKGKGRLADMLGTSQGAGGGAGTSPTAATGGLGGGVGGGLGGGVSEGMGGGLGGLLGGLGGGGLGAGLKDLLDRFRQTGHEDKAQSWVSTGSNQPIAPNELEQALGADRIQWLMEQTGLPKDQLLAGLSNELPSTIDKLTPNGQVPADDELDRQLHS